MSLNSAPQAPAATPDPLPRLLIFACVMILLIAMGSRATFGLFMQPMGMARGWGREIFSMAFAIQNLVWGVGAIALGAMADKFGAARTISLGALLYAIGWFGARMADSIPLFYLYAGVLMGLGQAGTTFAVILPIVARRVSAARRSTALGIASAGGSLGQFLIVPLGNQVIGETGWSGGLAFLALLCLGILPFVGVMVGRPRESATDTAVPQPLAQAVGIALRHKSYHLMFWSYFVCGFHTAFITLHLPAFVVDQGLSARDGAFAVATIGLFNVFGSYLAGRMGGRYSKKNLLAAIYALRAVFIALLLIFPVTPFILYLFAAGMGVLWLGTVPLTNGLVGQVYGLRFAATLSGIVFLGHQLGSFLGVWLGGRLYGLYGNYTVVWWLAIGLGLLAAVLCLPIRETPLSAPRTAPV